LGFAAVAKLEILATPYFVGLYASLSGIGMKPAIGSLP